MASNRNDHMTQRVNDLMTQLRQYEGNFINVYRPGREGVLHAIKAIFEQLPHDMTNRMFLHRYYRVNYMMNSIVTKDLPPEHVEPFQHGWHDQMEKYFFQTAPPTIANILDDPRKPDIVHQWARYVDHLNDTGRIAAIQSTGT